MKINSTESGWLETSLVAWLPGSVYEVLFYISFTDSSDRLYAVILDCHPIFTTIIILVGWVVKTAVASLVNGWVGRDEKTGEAWLAYSIP